jgi:fatty acid synthase
VQVHGYASKVVFRQACARIPEGALCLEVGPHALLRTPLRQNRHSPSQPAVHHARLL